MRLRLLAMLCTLVAGSSTALAQGDGRAFAPAPRSVELVSGNATVGAHAQGRAPELSGCRPITKATFARVRVSMRWRRDGSIRAVSVSSSGGAAFGRCVQRALRGTLATEASTRAGSGTATLIVRQVVVRTPAPPPPPPPIAKGDLQRCTLDADCVIHFQTSACIAGDPIAVNGGDMSAVRTKFPVRHLACGMGGPQYDKLRMQNEGRYSATCESSRCVVRDAGPRPAGPGEL